MGEGLPPPICLALVVCDTIWVDPFSGKSTIIGAFHEVGAFEFPAIHPILSVYATLTNARGKVPVTLQIIDVDEERDAVVRVDGELEFPDPRAVVDWNVQFQGLTFPQPGEYRVQLFSAEAFVIERRLLFRRTEG